MSSSGISMTVATRRLGRTFGPGWILSATPPAPRLNSPPTCWTYGCSDSCARRPWITNILSSPRIERPRRRVPSAARASPTRTAACDAESAASRPASKTLGPVRIPVETVRPKLTHRSRISGREPQRNMTLSEAAAPPGRGKDVLVEFPQDELIAKWEEFFEEMGYLSKIIAIADRFPEDRSLLVAFDELNRFDTDMAIYLLRHPLNVLLAGEEAIRRLAPPGDEGAQIHLRVKLLPRDRRVPVRALRPKHLGQYHAAQRLTLYLEDDLTGRITPGERVVMNGVLRSVQKGRPREKSTLFDIFMDVNSVEKEQVEFEEIEVTEEDARLIREMGTSPDIFRMITASIAPSMYGMHVEKEALALQLFSGVPKVMPDGRRIRGDIHVLMVGDPGIGKSELLSYMSRLSPRGIYATGKSSTAAGLTASAVRDEFGEGRWTLEAGALVLADLGLACLHPSAEVFIDGLPHSIEGLFDASKSVQVIAAGGHVELSTLARPTFAFDKERVQVRNQTAAFVTRKSYRGPILHITLASGFELRVTPDHLVLDGESFRWKKLQDIRPTGKLVACQRLPNETDEVYLLDILPDDWIVQPSPEEKEELRRILTARFPTLAAANRAYDLPRNALNGRSALGLGAFRAVLRDVGLYHSWRTKAFAYGRRKSTERLRVATITPELAYVLGFVRGDGNVRRDDRHSTVSISQSRVHLQQIVRLLQVTKTFTPRNGGMHPRVEQSRIRGRSIESACYYMDKGSNLLAFIYEWLTKDDLANFLRLDDSAMRGFLAGLFDADGCVSVKHSTVGGKPYNCVELQFMFSSSARSNKRLLYALRRFDIYARIRAGKNVLFVQVTSRSDIQRLLLELGPLSVKAKAVPAAGTLQRAEHEEAPSEIVSSILAQVRPRPWRLLNKRYWSQLHDLAHARRRPFKATLAKLADNMKPWLSDEDYERLAALTARDYALDRIVEVRVEEHEGYVYDLRVH